jgi:hypothetical protein
LKPQSDEEETEDEKWERTKKWWKHFFLRGFVWPPTGLGVGALIHMFMV